MKDEYIIPDIQYQAPDYVGQSVDKVGIDHFMLHFGLWSNHYSKRLQQAGIRYNPESKTLKMTCDANSHLQIYNPVANFWDAITYVGLLSMYENKFVTGDVKELIGTVGSEEINLFCVSADSSDICNALGYKHKGESFNEITESINNLSLMTALYRVKGDANLKGTELEGCHITKKGKGRIIENRTIRFVYKYVRKEIKHGSGENVLLLDGDFIRHCHIGKYTIRYKKLFELRGKLNKKKLKNEAVLGLYLYLLGNVATNKEKGRYYPIHWIQEYFQIVTPKLISDLPVDQKLFGVQQEIYAEVVKKYRTDLRNALDKLQELGLIQGWKACFEKGFKRDKRAKSNYVNLEKAKGLKIWM